MSVVSTLQIHQAYFGAVNGTSHGQLASSLTDPDLRSFLSAFTDRPGVPPAGFEIPPYLAATTYREYYLICRTWPDNEVSRLGMVFTHVLILSLQDLPKIPELNSVLSLLLENPVPVIHRPASLDTLFLPKIDCQKNELVSDVPESWLEIISQMIDWHPSLSPIFVLGEDNRFQELLEALWRGLPSTLRGLLDWGIRFTPPNSSSASLPMLINVPVELEAKWRGKAVIKLATDVIKTPETPIEQLILNKKQGYDFLEFINNIEISISEFKYLKLCQRAYEQFKSLQTADLDTGKLLALLRTLRQLQPDPNKAVEIKRSTVKLLAEALPIVGAKEAMGLRNLPLTPFLSEAKSLERAVGQVVHDIIMTSNPDEILQKSLIGYLADTDPESIEAWWRKVATKEFEQTFVSNSIQVARVVWLSMLQEEAIRNYILSLIPNAADWEYTLSKNIPASLPASVTDTVTSFSAGRNWWDLFAAAVGASYKPAEALQKQVKAEKHLNIPISPRVSKLAKQVPDDELVELAVKLPNTQLHELAGEVCGRNPNLLASIDVRQKSWRTIWSRSLALTKSITAGLSKPVETIHAFLTEVANGRSSDTQPLDLIAVSTFANVLHLPERTSLWDKLPTNVLSKFVEATLDGLVEEILNNKWAGPIDLVLSTKARSVEFIGKFLSQKRNNLADVLAVDAVLHILTDNYLKDYINNLTAINGVTAAQLGKFIALKRWHLCANALLSKAKYNADFRPALYECAGMFGFLTKFMNHELFGYQVTRQDAWNALEELMANLYEEGPDKDNIWKRAGGDVTKLSNAQSRREQWSAAIGLLRHGGGGKKISAESLIVAALNDYKNNLNLQTLADSKHLFKS